MSSNGYHRQPNEWKESLSLSPKELTKNDDDFVCKRQKESPHCGVRVQVLLTPGCTGECVSSTDSLSFVTDALLLHASVGQYNEKCFSEQSNRDVYIFVELAHFWQLFVTLIISRLSLSLRDFVCAPKNVGNLWMKKVSFSLETRCGNATHIAGLILNYNRIIYKAREKPRVWICEAVFKIRSGARKNRATRAWSVVLFLFSLFLSFFTCVCFRKWDYKRESTN